MGSDDALPPEFVILLHNERRVVCMVRAGTRPLLSEGGTENRAAGPKTEPKRPKEPLGSSQLPPVLMAGGTFLSSFDNDKLLCHPPFR